MAASGDDAALESYGADIGRQDDLLVRIREWVLLEGNRVLIAVLISTGTFVLFYLLGVAELLAYVNDDSITRLAGGLTAGLFSLVTIVVTINQLLLSREFAGAGTARERLEGVIAFRDAVADAAEVPASPAAPTRLLQLLAETMHERADDIAVSVDEHDDDDESQELVTQYAHRLGASSERLHTTLEQTEFGTFQAMSALIRYDSGWQLYAAQHLTTQYRESLPEKTVDSLERLIEELKLFDIAQEHFKTTYLQRELTRFSRLTIYSGVPAIFAAIGLGFLYADFGGATISPAYLDIVSPALVGVMALPLGLLASYVLRTATVIRRTASIGPMTPQKQPAEGPFDVTTNDGDAQRGVDT